jgi:DNA-binding transcriptional ArsR family regulator
MRRAQPAPIEDGSLVQGDPFRAIADAGRRRILDALTLREYSVTELTGLLGISQPAVSQHLRVLREAGMVKERSEGRFRYYRLQGEPLRDVHEWVAQYESFWSTRLDALARHLKKKGH